MKPNKTIYFDQDVIDTVNNYRKTKVRIPSFTNAVNTLLKPVVIDTLLSWLADHENDIALSMNDYGQWKEAFHMLKGWQAEDK